MDSRRLNISLNIDFAESFLRPHELELLDKLGAAGSAECDEFKRQCHNWAGGKLRDMMDARRVSSADESIGANKYGEPNWPKPGERTTGYGHPSGHGEHHANCRCVMKLTEPTINLTAPIMAEREQARINEIIRREFVAKSPFLMNILDASKRVDIARERAEVARKRVVVARKRVAKAKRELRAHKPVTRGEAAKAVRAVQKAEREQREADRKTARAQAAIKGWETRRKATRKKVRA